VSSTARKPGRPRSADADRAIFTKTLELLADEGLRGFSVEKVAARAGVGKATVYRRFPTGRDLIVAALASVAGFGPPEPPDTGSVRTDLQRVVRARIEVMRQTGAQMLMPRLVADSASDPELHALVIDVFANPVRVVTQEILRRGVARGELRGDVDVGLVTDLIGGVVVYRLLLTRGDLRGLAARVERAIDLVLEGVALRLP
jgi:AcrR family transcriptional regulator